MSRRIKLEDIKYATVPANDDVISIKAKSSTDEIRFYFNQKQYVTGIEMQDGSCSIEFREDELESKLNNELIQHKIIVSTSKENILFLITISLIMTVFIALIFLNVKSPFIATSGIIYLNCIGDLIAKIHVNNKNISKALKSKHSAEHMMCNFIKKNRRLPREWNEIRKSARFSSSCGSVRRMKSLAERTVFYILYGILFSCIGIMADLFIQNEKVLVILYGINIFLIHVVTLYLIKKYKIFNYLIKGLQRLYGHFLQYGNTTKNVKQKDILLAYKVASIWWQIVYPEYCDKDSKFTRNE